MISLDEVNAIIEELEAGEITLKTCNDLANLYVIKDHMLDQDLLPGSKVDERIDELQTFAIRYVMEKDLLSLNYFLTNLEKIVSELFHNAETQKERSEFYNFIKNINVIIERA